MLLHSQWSIRWIVETSTCSSSKRILYWQRWRWNSSNDLCADSTLKKHRLKPLGHESSQRGVLLGKRDRLYIQTAVAEVQRSRFKIFSCSKLFPSGRFKPDTNATRTNIAGPFHSFRISLEISLFERSKDRGRVHARQMKRRPHTAVYSDLFDAEK